MVFDGCPAGSSLLCGDASISAMQAAISAGLSHLTEMAATGFDTTNRFDDGYLTNHTASGQPFVVCSTGGTQYIIACIRRVGNGYQAGIQLHFPERKHRGFNPKVLRRVTLTKAADGSIRVDPGWSI